MEIIDADGSIGIPGLKDDESPADEDVRNVLLIQIGRKLKRCFGESDKLNFDGFLIEREDWLDDSSRPRHRYQVVAGADSGSSLDAPLDAPLDREQLPVGESTDFGVENPKTEISLDAPLDAPLDKTRVSLDPLDTS